MCDYTQVEYNCQHFRFVVLRWCPRYERTYKPCAPNVTHLEVRGLSATVSAAMGRYHPQRPWPHAMRLNTKIKIETAIFVVSCAHR
ncbi:hypothetical protein F5Y08DRAFT_345333 [Xylaria arbuscula]|nr:hypothetical protein F5Y08DRAFT_345333 [Xylaria arbuscula]